MPSQLPPQGLVIVDDTLARIERLPAKPVNNSHELTFEEETIQALGGKKLPVVESSTTQPLDSDSELAPPVRVLKPVGQHSNWRLLKDKPLWAFFDKVREIRRASPDSESVARLHREIKTELFNRYLPDTLKQVGSYFARKMPKFSLLHEEDLQEATKTSLWKYLEKYDPNYGTITFMQFFNAKGKSRLLGSILDSLRALQEFSRPIAQQRRELKPMFLALAQKLKHKPSIEEFLDEYGWEARGSSGLTYREILSNPLFSAGVFNQRQAVSSLSEGLDEEEMESLTNYESRPAKNVSRMENCDTWQHILSVIEDEDIHFIIDAYYREHDTNDKICYYLNSYGRKCSLSWVVGKHKEGLRIIKEKFGRRGLELLARRHDEE